MVEENHSSAEVLGSSSAPYLRHLAATGARFSHYHAITHPSQPNYLALFSGSTQQVRDDSCPHRFTRPNLGSELRSHHRSFAGYAEGLPKPGSTVCRSGSYARKHAPWTNFTDLPAATSRPLQDFPSDYNKLPTVAFVIPDLDHDMHDGTIGQADSWLQQHLSRYVTWARTHNSLLIITADEDDKTADNVVPTVIVGDHVRVGTISERVTHYSLLRLLEDTYRLPRLGHSATATPIRDLWR
ncbi:alkaline phosphatase family protein [Microlunatus elymi]|uniref:alkaline phosphatase family protein n=1 Tax=Microlunatus elymi TaxID=2596828 RepID=UPI001AEFB550|nr:alkaline phosphatase family protein [Microlunatus elymi]